MRPDPVARRKPLFSCYQGTVAQARIQNDVELLREFQARGQGLFWVYITCPCRLFINFFLTIFIDDRSNIKHRNRKEPDPMKTDTQPKPVFLQTVSVALRQLKQRLQQDYEQTYPDLREIVHLVLDEEEIKAWELSLFPHVASSGSGRSAHRQAQSSTGAHAARTTSLVRRTISRRGQ